MTQVDHAIFSKIVGTSFSYDGQVFAHSRLNKGNWISVDLWEGKESHLEVDSLGKHFFIGVHRSL